MAWNILEVQSSCWLVGLSVCLLLECNDIFTCCGLFSCGLLYPCTQIPEFWLEAVLDRTGRLTVKLRGRAHSSHSPCEVLCVPGKNCTRGEMLGLGCTIVVSI